MKIFELFIGWSCVIWAGVALGWPFAIAAFVLWCIISCAMDDHSDKQWRDAERFRRGQ